MTHDEVFDYANSDEVKQAASDIFTELSKNNDFELSDLQKAFKSELIDNDGFLSWNTINHTSRAWLELNGDYLEMTDCGYPGLDSNYAVAIGKSFPDLLDEYGENHMDEAVENGEIVEFESDSDLNTYVAAKYNISSIEEFKQFFMEENLLLSPDEDSIYDYLRSLRVSGCNLPDDLFEHSDIGTFASECISDLLNESKLNDYLLLERPDGLYDFYYRDINDTSFKDYKKASPADFSQILEKEMASGSVDIALSREYGPAIIKACKSPFAKKISLYEYITENLVYNSEARFNKDEIDLIEKKYSEILPFRVNENGIFRGTEKINLYDLYDLGRIADRVLDDTAENKLFFDVLHKYRNTFTFIDYDYGILSSNDDNQVSIAKDFINWKAGFELVDNSQTRLIIKALEDNDDSFSIRKGDIKLFHGDVEKGHFRFWGLADLVENCYNHTHEEDSLEKIKSVRENLKNPEKGLIHKIEENLDFHSDIFENRTGNFAESKNYYIASADGSVCMKINLPELNSNPPKAKIETIYKTTKDEFYGLSEEIEIPCKETVNNVYESDMASFIYNQAIEHSIFGKDIEISDYNVFRQYNEKLNAYNKKLAEEIENQKDFVFTVDANLKVPFLPTEKSRKYRDTAIVVPLEGTIKAVKEKDFPVAFKVTDFEFLFKGTKESEVHRYYNDYFTEELRTYKGKIYKPVHEWNGSNKSVFYKKVPDRNDLRLIENQISDDVYSNSQFDKEKSVIPPVLKDTKISEAQLKLQKECEQYIISNGILWEECGEPYYYINHFGIKSEPGEFIGYDLTYGKEADESKIHYSSNHIAEGISVFNKEIESLQKATGKPEKYFKHKGTNIEIVMPEMVRIKDHIDIEREEKKAALEAQKKEEKGTVWFQTSWKGWEFSAEKDFSKSVAVRPSYNGHIILAFKGDADKFIEERYDGKYTTILNALNLLLSNSDVRQKLGLTEKKDFGFDLASIKIINKDNPKLDVKHELLEKMGYVLPPEQEKSEQGFKLLKTVSGIDYMNIPYNRFILELTDLRSSDSSGEERDFLDRLSIDLKRPEEGEGVYLIYDVNADGSEGWKAFTAPKNNETEELIEKNTDWFNFPAGEEPDSYLKENILSYLKKEVGPFRERLKHEFNKVADYMSIVEIAQAFDMPEMDFRTKLNNLNSGISTSLTDKKIATVQKLISERVDDSVLNVVKNKNGFSYIFNRSKVTDEACKNLAKKFVTETSVNDAELKKDFLKNIQKEYEKELKNNPLVQHAVGRYMLENPAFFFENEQALKVYENDRKLMTEVTKADELFLKAYEKEIEKLPDFFGTGTSFDAENQLNLLTYAKFREGWRNILEENISRAERGEAPAELSVDSVMKNVPDYCKVSELGSILSSDNAYYNSEKELFEISFAKHYNNELLKERIDIEKNRNFGINSFLELYNVKFKEMPSAEPKAVFKEIYSSLSKAQRTLLKSEMKALGIDSDKKFSDFLLKKKQEMNLDIDISSSDSLKPGTKNKTDDIERGR